MAGLDPETLRALGIAGVVATVLASLIAAGANLIGQAIQRGTAKQVAQIQAEVQRDLDYRKAVREYREQLVAPVRAMAVGRHALWLKLAAVVSSVVMHNSTDSAPIEAVLGELSAAESQVPPSYGDALNADVQRELEAFRQVDGRLRDTFIEAVEHKEIATFAGSIAPQMRDLEARVVALHRAIERYVLGSPGEDDRALAPARGAPD